MFELVSANAASDLPKAVTFESCDFPIIPGEVRGYRVIRLPAVLRRVFDERGAHIVRINSLAIAARIPDFGGKASGEDHSLLPHQDHLDPADDQRRFLMLTKHENGARGSSTLIMTPTIAARMLPLVEAWMTDHERRKVIGAERKYDERFRISREQYDSCFDEEGGYERVVRGSLGAMATQERNLSMRLGILGYLIRGSSANLVMREIVGRFHGEFYEERWERGGIVIIDNPRVFHARFGGNNPPLQRNFCT